MFVCCCALLSTQQTIAKPLQAGVSSHPTSRPETCRSALSCDTGGYKKKPSALRHSVSFSFGYGNERISLKTLTHNISKHLSPPFRPVVLAFFDALNLRRSGTDRSKRCRRAWGFMPHIMTLLMTQLEKFTWTFHTLRRIPWTYPMEKPWMLGSRFIMSMIVYITAIYSVNTCN